MAPLFLAYGLVKGAYIGTESLSTVVMHTTKLVALGGTSLHTPAAAGVGLALGPMRVAGSVIGKRVLDRLPEQIFIAIIEATLVVSGFIFLLGA
jgi:hypothetical protein